MELSPIIIEDAVRAALKEDMGHGFDITSSLTIAPDTQTTVHLRARENGVLAGIEVALTAFRLCDGMIIVKRYKRDGEALAAGDKIATITGNARAILTAERIALNFLTHMCGIAAGVKKYVDAVSHTNAKICDTRKTLPNLRAFQKYAVTCGGGRNHRFGLDDAIMIKDNHIAAVGDITAALSRVCSAAPHTKMIEIEVDTLDQLQAVIAFNAAHKNKTNTRGADIVLLDNMPPETLTKAVDMVGGTMITEASGGVTLKTVHDIAQSGVDMISIGALTHSVMNFDIGLDSDD